MRKPKTAEIVVIGLAKPNPDVVAIAESILKLAKEGKLRSIAWVGDVGTQVASGWSPGTDIFMTVGMIERMKHRLLVHAEERTTFDAD